MSRANRKAPNHLQIARAVMEPKGWWRGMSPERLQQARMALSGDAEDTTDEERDALQEYITLGGNVAGL